jgi:hypothetical protein
VSHRGRFFSLEGVRFLPEPVQAPRVPIWVGGTLGRKAPLRRAARWDGAFPQKIPTEPEDWQLTLEEVREFLASVALHRADDRPFDLVIAGDPPGEDAVDGAAKIERYAAAGVTWWMAGIFDEMGSLDELRAIVRRGPWGR